MKKRKNNNKTSANTKPKINAGFIGKYKKCCVNSITDALRSEGIPISKMKTLKTRNISIDQLSDFIRLNRISIVLIDDSVTYEDMCMYASLEEIKEVIKMYGCRLCTVEQVHNHN
jgi:predicted GTPase